MSLLSTRQMRAMSLLLIFAFMQDASSSHSDNFETLCKCGTIELTTSDQLSTVDVKSTRDCSKQSGTYFNPNAHDGKCYVTFEYRNCSSAASNCKKKPSILSVHFNKFGDGERELARTKDKTGSVLISDGGFNISLVCASEFCNVDFNVPEKRLLMVVGSFAEYQKKATLLKKITKNISSEIPKTTRTKRSSEKNAEMTIINGRNSEADDTALSQLRSVFKAVEKREAGTATKCLCGSVSIGVMNEFTSFVPLPPKQCNPGQDDYKVEPVNGRCFITYESKQCESGMNCLAEWKYLVTVYYNKFGFNNTALHNNDTAIGWVKYESGSEFIISLTCNTDLCKIQRPNQIDKAQLIFDKENDGFFTISMQNLGNMESELQKAPEEVKPTTSQPTTTLHPSLRAKDCYCGKMTLHIHNSYDTITTNATEHCDEDKLYNSTAANGRCFLSIGAVYCTKSLPVEGCRNGATAVVELFFNKMDLVGNLSTSLTDFARVDLAQNEFQFNVTISCETTYCTPAKASGLSRNSGLNLAHINKLLNYVQNSTQKPVLVVKTTTEITLAPVWEYETTAAGPDDDGGLGGGTIAGIVIGCLFLICAVLAIGFCICKRKKIQALLEERKNKKRTGQKGKQNKGAKGDSNTTDTIGSGNTPDKKTDQPPAGVQPPAPAAGEQPPAGQAAYQFDPPDPFAGSTFV